MSILEYLEQVTKNEENMEEDSSSSLNEDWHVGVEECPPAISKSHRIPVKSTRLQKSRENHSKLMLKKKEMDKKREQSNEDSRLAREAAFSKKLAPTISKAKSLQTRKIGSVAKKDVLLQKERDWRDWLILRKQEHFYQQTNLAKMIGDDDGLCFDNIHSDEESQESITPNKSIVPPC